MSVHRLPARPGIMAGNHEAENALGLGNGTSVGVDTPKSRLFWKSDIPWYRKLDIIYYLTFCLIPMLVAFTWTLTLLSFITDLTIQNSFQAWFLILISFSYLPLFLLGSYGWYPLRSVKTWLLVTLTVAYTYHWIPEMFYGLRAVMSKREPVWEKTKRIDLLYEA